MKGRPILGAVCGLIFGLFLALDLQQFSVRPLDNLSLFGLPILGLLVGLALGLTSPLRSLRKDRRPPSAAPPATAVPMGPSGQGADQAGGSSSTV